eukprot:268030_1
MLAVDDPSATDDDTKSLISKQPSNATESKSTIKKKKRKTFYQWLWSNPLSKLPFIYFVVGLLGVAALAVFHIMDPDTLNIFGIKHFYTLIGLKKVTYGCMFFMQRSLLLDKSK